MSESDRQPGASSDHPAEEISRAGLTRFLNDLREGDEAAGTTLLPVLVSELRKLAQRHFAAERGKNTLQPTALVNEVYLKLFRAGSPDWNDRDHFFAIAARAMRQIMIDQARRRRSQKRGGGNQAVTLDEAMAVAAGIDVELLDLHAGLEQLEELDPQQGKVMELRYFLGLEIAEVAAVMGISEPTARREWRAGRAWLGQHLGKGQNRG